jgi:hypothetical protein
VKERGTFVGETKMAELASTKLNPESHLLLVRGTLSLYFAILGPLFLRRSRRGLGD